MLLVGLTGNIASGKSLVTDRLMALGATVIDADALAREAVAPQSRGGGLSSIAARWGPDILRPDGSLDRAALRRLVFADSAERAALDAIVHPIVEARRLELVARARDTGASIVVCDIPLLFEKDLAAQFDFVILVDSPDSLRLERLIRSRGLSDPEARAMMDAQMPAAEKRARADLVIGNAGSIDALAAAVDAAWLVLQARAASLS